MVITVAVTDTLFYDDRSAISALGSPVTSFGLTPCPHSTARLFRINVNDLDVSIKKVIFLASLGCHRSLS